MTRYALSLLASAFLTVPGFGATDLFDGFAPGWRERWEEKRFFTKPTVYEVTTENGRSVLHASSRGSHGGLVRRLTVETPTSARVRWQWRIERPLETNTRERTRGGDDFAAHVMVIFEDSVLPFRTRALNYVWAAHEPVGSIYPSPYSRNVGMCVLRSGRASAGQWVSETRDLVADYLAYFGEMPHRISGVAVLVDTDNTGLEADAWFAALALETSPPVKF